MRIFVGIDLDEAIRGKIARFVEGVSGFAPEARFVRPESLHVTLKFIGEQKPEQVEAVAQKLRGIRGDRFEIRFAEFGFFPTAKSPRVFWIGIHAGPELTALAKRVDDTTAELGVPREDRAYSPHLTLARERQVGRSKVARGRRTEFGVRSIAEAAGRDGRDRVRYNDRRRFYSLPKPAFVGGIEVYEAGAIRVARCMK